MGEIRLSGNAESPPFLLLPIETWAAWQLFLIQLLESSITPLETGPDLSDGFPLLSPFS